MKVGILQSTDPERGIHKSAEIVSWAARHHETSMFPVRTFGRLYRDPPADFLAWAASQDVVIFIEQLLPKAIEAVLGRGCRVVFIPNLDWAVLWGEKQLSPWLGCLRSLPVHVWSRTASTQSVLGEARISSRLIPWSIPDPVVLSRETRSDGEVVLFMNAGRGGFLKRRGVDIVLRAFALVRRTHRGVRLILKSLRPLSQLADLEEPGEGVTIIESWYSRAQLDEIYRQVDVAMHPSRWEGLGLPLLESLHAGLPVITTDGWPMNEFVDHERTGLLVPARRVGNFRLAAHWEPAANDLAAVMARLIEDMDLRRRLTCPCPREWVQRQRAFTAAVDRALCD
jgi:glycosyltransferase involved in cell wall biosynthesis